MNKELQIIEHYGLSNQLKKLNSEFYELIEAIWEDDGSEECLEHIREEFIDVNVLLNQIKALYELYKRPEKNKLLYDFKIERTLIEMENPPKDGERGLYYNDFISNRLEDDSNGS